MASIFSRIAAGEIPSWKVAEDDRYYAFLDINPLVEGHTLVIPKKEVDYIFDLEDDELAEEKEVMKAEFARYGLPLGSISDDMLDSYAKERLAKDEERRRIRPIVINNKLTKIIKEKATLNSKDISYDDFVKLFESEK